MEVSQWKYSPTHPRDQQLPTLVLAGKVEAFFCFLALRAHATVERLRNFISEAPGFRCPTRLVVLLAVLLLVVYLSQNNHFEKNRKTRATMEVANFGWFRFLVDEGPLVEIPFLFRQHFSCTVYLLQGIGLAIGFHSQFLLKNVRWC